jgi:hypothetical protein
MRQTAASMQVRRRGMRHNDQADQYAEHTPARCKNTPPQRRAWNACMASTIPLNTIS